MSFIDLAKSRFSVRSFQNKPVSDDLIDKILQAGLAAPTACNNQPQKIIVVRSEEGLAKLRKCTECHFNAPLAMIVSYDSRQCWTRSYDGKTSGEVDASIVTTHLMLEAADLGIGSTWVMYFIPEAVRTEFALPDSVVPVAILVMGWPAESCVPSRMHTSRKARETQVSFE